MSASPDARVEALVTLDTVAVWYRVEARWIEEVHAEGLLQRVERVGGSIAFPASELDRLARVLRWHRQFGLDLGTVLALLD
jgi:hypothetical protein